MWDCWDAGVIPRFYAWNRQRWTRWSVGEVSTDHEKCPHQGQRKVVYRYRVTLKGHPVAGKPYNLLRVKEDCNGCEASPWTLPITVH
jgi:hypothetical protein